MASDAEVDLLINAAGTLPELERDLSRIISIAQRNADDIDINAAVDVRDTIDSTLRDLDRVRRAAEDGAEDIDLLAVLDQIDSLTALRADVDRVVTQVGDQAPDIDLTAVLNRTRSLSNVTRDLNAVIATAQANADDIDVDVDIDTDDADVSTRRLSRTLASATGVALRAAGSFARVGAGAGAMGVAVGGAVVVVGALVQEMTNMVPAAAVGVSALLTLQLASGTAKLALQGVEEALTSVFDPDADPEELAKQLERLAPNARKFVVELQGMSKELRRIQQSVQNRFFRGFDGELRRLSSAVLPSVERAIGDTADSLNRMARGAAASASELGERGILGQALGSSTRSLRNLERIPGQIVAALGQLAAAAGPTLERLSRAVAEKADEMSERLSGAFESGALQDAIEGAIDQIRQLGRIGGNILGGLGNIFRGLSTDGGGLFGTLEKITQAFEDLTASDEAQEFFGAVGAALSEVSKALGPLLESLGELIKGVLPIATRLFEFFADLIERIAPVLEDVARELVRFLTPAFEAIGKVLDRLLPVFLDLVDKILPKLRDIWREISPLVEELSIEFGKLIEELAPLIEEVLKLAFAIIERLLPVITLMIAGGLVILIGWIKILTRVFRELEPAIEAITMLINGDFSGALDLAQKNANRLAVAVSVKFQEISDSVRRRMTETALSVAQKAVELKDKFLEAVGELGRRAGEFFGSLPGRFRRAIAQQVAQLAAAGRDLMDGLAQGMLSRLQRLREIASDIAAVVRDTVKNVLRIQSPSRVFMDIGDDTVQGFIDGLRAAAPGLEDTMRGIVQDFTVAGTPEDPSVRLVLPDAPRPVVAVAIAGEAVDRRFISLTDQRIADRERDRARGVRV